MADIEVRQESSPPPPPPPSGGGGMGWILALVVLVLVLLLAWFLFAGNGGEPDTQIDLEVPQAEAPTIEVPDEIDVDVRTDGGGN